MTLCLNVKRNDPLVICTPDGAVIVEVIKSTDTNIRYAIQAPDNTRIYTPNKLRRMLK